MWNIYIFGWNCVQYINIVNDAALECTIEIFSASTDSKKNMPHQSSDCLSTLPVSYITRYILLTSQDIFNFAASCLGDSATDGLKKSCNIIRKKYDSVFF